MRAGLLWALLVAVGLLAPAGIANAAECGNEEAQAQTANLTTFTFAMPPPWRAELNGSVEMPNSTVVFWSGSGGALRACYTMDSPSNPAAATSARPPPEPEWPEVTSLATEVLSSDAAMVYWTTNIPTVGRVVWGPSGQRATGTAASELFATEHAVRVGGLTPGETYALHIIAFDGRAQVQFSDPVEFMTPLPPRDTSADALLVAASVGATLGICDLIRRRK